MLVRTPLFLAILAMLVFQLLGTTSSTLLNISPAPPPTEDLDPDMENPRPFFIAHRQSITNPVVFRLLEAHSSNDAPPEAELDNFFELEVTVVSNRISPFIYTFIRDDLMRVREIKKTDQGREVLSITFQEDGQLGSIQEVIPEELTLRVLFNPRGQMANKIIEAPGRSWEYRYRYRQGRLARMISLYNGAVLNDRVISWEPGPEGREINRTEEFNGLGKKMGSWIMERDLSLRWGYGEESARKFTPSGKLKEETLRLWADGRISEEHVFLGNLYHRNLLTYDRMGLIQEKKVLDVNGEMIAHHLYRYRLPERIGELVFLGQLQMNTMETSYYRLGGRIAIEKNQVFDLRTLVSSFQEEISEDQSQTRRSYTGGLETRTTRSREQLEKRIIDPRTGITLSIRKFLYDSYGRISDIVHYFPDQSFSRSHFLYEEKPLKMASIMNNDIPTFLEEGVYLGSRFLNYIKKRMKNIPQQKTKNLEEQFQYFKRVQRIQAVNEEDASLLSHLKFLRESKIGKVINYNRQGKVDHYYRIQHLRFTPQIWEARFTTYVTPPALDLERSRISSITDPDNYYIPGYPDLASAVNNPNYSVLERGGKMEFFNQTPDNLDPQLEKPLETIIIRYTDSAILLNAQQIFYNPITGVLEKEIFLQNHKIKEINR